MLMSVVGVALLYSSGIMSYHRTITHSVTEVVRCSGVGLSKAGSDQIKRPVKAKVDLPDAHLSARFFRYWATGLIIRELYLYFRCAFWAAISNIRKQLHSCMIKHEGLTQSNLENRGMLFRQKHNFERPPPHDTLHGLDPTWIMMPERLFYFNFFRVVSGSARTKRSVQTATTSQAISYTRDLFGEWGYPCGRT